MPEIDRRDFLKIVGMTAGAAATVACNEPIQKIIPYLNQPTEVIPGLATWYNSTCRACPAACSVRVKTREGRLVDVDPSTLRDLSDAGLYNLSDDIGETRNRAAERPDKVRELSDLWQQWNRQLAKPSWPDG